MISHTPSHTQIHTKIKKKKTIFYDNIYLQACILFTLPTTRHTCTRRTTIVRILDWISNKPTSPASEKGHPAQGCPPCFHHLSGMHTGWARIGAGCSLRSKCPGANAEGQFLLCVCFLLFPAQPKPGSVCYCRKQIPLLTRLSAVA